MRYFLMSYSSIFPQREGRNNGVTEVCFGLVHRQNSSFVFQKGVVQF